MGERTLFGGGGGAAAPALHGWFLTASGFLLPSSTTLAIPWATDVLDTDGYHSGTDTFVTIPQTGWYQLWANVCFSDGAAGVGQLDVDVQRNALPPTPTYDPVPGYLQMQRDSTGPIQLHLGSMAELVEGDTLIITVLQTTGVDLSIVADQTYYEDTWFQGRYLGLAG